LGEFLFSDLSRLPFYGIVKHQLLLLDEGENDIGKNLPGKDSGGIPFQPPSPFSGGGNENLLPRKRGDVLKESTWRVVSGAMRAAPSPETGLFQ